MKPVITLFLAVVQPPYTWDAVTSVNLNISMVRYLRRHLVCTVHCLHEQEWWLLMRWSCEKKVDRHLLFDKVKSFGIDSCLYEFPKNDWVDDTKLCTFPDVLPHRRAGRLHWGKAESIGYNFVISRMGQVTTGIEAQFCLSFQRCVHRHSCWSQASQRINKKPHKVWVAVHTDGTILLMR